MENDKGAYYLLIRDAGHVQTSETYDNAEAARKAAHIYEQTEPDGTRRLFKMLPETDPIEVMI